MENEPEGTMSQYLLVLKTDCQAHPNCVLDLTFWEAVVSFLASKCILGTSVDNLE